MADSTPPAPACTRAAEPPVSAVGGTLRGMTVPEVAFKLEGISPRAYQHPADRAATAALARVPYLDEVVRRLVALGYERALRAAVARFLGPPRPAPASAGVGRCTARSATRSTSSPCPSST